MILDFDCMDRQIIKREKNSTKIWSYGVNTILVNVFVSWSHATGVVIFAITILKTANSTISIFYSILHACLCVYLFQFQYVYNFE